MFRTAGSRIQRQRDRNLKSPVNKFQTLALKGMRTKRKTQTAVEGFAQTEEFAYLLSSLNINRRPLDQWEFVQNKEKLKFYSGLPSFDILHNVFEHVFPFIAYR